MLELGSEGACWVYVSKFCASKPKSPWLLPFWLLTNLLFGFVMEGGSCESSPRPRKERNICRSCIVETMDS